MTNFIFKGSALEALEYRAKGMKVICPVCSQDLVIVISDSDISKFGKNPGIYCTTDEVHVKVSLHINRTRKNKDSTNSDNNHDRVCANIFFGHIQFSIDNLYKLKNKLFSKNKT